MSRDLEIQKAIDFDFDFDFDFDDIKQDIDNTNIIL